MNLLDFTLFADCQQFMIVGGIIFISQIIYAALGFGSGMFAISLLAFLYGDLTFFVPFFTLICFPTEAIIAVKDRHDLQLKDIRVFLIFIVPGLWLGSFLLKQANDPIYLIILGVIVLMLSLYYLWGEKRWQFTWKSSAWKYGFGLISGVLGGLFGMAGPPLIFYFKHQNMSKRQFRVALLSIFAVMTVVRIGFYLMLKIIVGNMLGSVVLVVPFALAGLAVGNWLHDRVSEQKFKLLTTITLAISGVMIIIKNI